MKWIKASEQRPPEVDGYFNAKYDNEPCIIRTYIHNTAVWNIVDEFWIYNYDFNRLEWLDESSQPSTAKWSDSDVKKFLEDYRVASLEIYLNPFIWFDKLNDEK